MLHRESFLYGEQLKTISRACILFYLLYFSLYEKYQLIKFKNKIKPEFTFQIIKKHTQPSLDMAHIYSYCSSSQRCVKHIFLSHKRAYCKSALWVCVIEAKVRKFVR